MTDTHTNEHMQNHASTTPDVSNETANPGTQRIALIGSTADTMLGFRAGLITALIAQGKQVYAFAIDYDNDDRAAVRALGAIPVDFRLSRSGMNPLTEAKHIFHLTRQLRAIAPDAVLSYFAKPVLLGTIAAFFAGVKRRIGMLEGLGYAFTFGPDGPTRRQQLTKHLQITLYRAVFPLLERIIFLNQDDRIELIERHRIHGCKAHTLGAIGLDLSAYPYSAPPVSPVRFIFAGRLLAEKGVNEYIAAAQRVKAQFPDTRFVILGGIDTDNPGAMSADWLQKNVDSGLIEYPGYVDNVAAWLTAASVFVLPSYYREGFPRSTQEAMAVGRPIITTDVPGCRETVADGHNGFLIPPWSATALAEKMIFFAENPGQIKVMGEASYAMARNRFDERKINRRLIHWLENDA